jgi:hypothetical protein
VDFKIFYTEPALTDLEEIKAWSWEYHPDTTVRFLSDLLNHIDSGNVPHDRDTR